MLGIIAVIVVLGLVVVLLSRLGGGEGAEGDPSAADSVASPADGEQ